LYILYQGQQYELINGVDLGVVVVVTGANDNADADPATASVVEVERVRPAGEDTPREDLARNRHCETNDSTFPFRRLLVLQTTLLLCIIALLVVAGKILVIVFFVASTKTRPDFAKCLATSLRFARQGLRANLARARFLDRDDDTEVFQVFKDC
jgi:hypothetical protein